MYVCVCEERGGGGKERVTFLTHAYYPKILILEEYKV